MSLQIPSGCDQPFGVVTEHPERSIAWVAKQASDLIGDVTVVDVQPLLRGGRPAADCADTALRFTELLVLL
jgi:hypothetical protein